MSAWQPIETAPKDGTRILMADGKLFTAGRWAKSIWTPGGRWSTDYPIAFLEDDEETVNHDGGFDNEVDHPTHWMPLPEPPE